MPRIQVRVTPNARRTACLAGDDDLLHIKLSAPAVEGKANAALVEWMAERLGIPKSSISIVRGRGSRIKVLELPLDPADVRLRLFGSADPASD